MTISLRPRGVLISIISVVASTPVAADDDVGDDALGPGAEGVVPLEAGGVVEVA